MPSESERRQIAAITGQLRGAVEATVRGIGATLLSELATVTPRQTGWTAAQWRASRGRPEARTVGTRSSSGVARAKAAQAASRAEIESFGLEHGTLHVSNASPNAAALNRGTSSKEPAAFVERSIRKATTTAAARAVGRRRGGG